MSRFLLTGDLHAGVRGNHDTFLESLEKSFSDFIIPLAKKEKVKDIKILGDVLDNRSILNIKVQNKIIDIFKTLKDFNVCILVGNHDLYYKNRKSIIGCSFLNKIFDNVEIISDITEREEHGKKILYAPWICSTEEREALLSKLESNQYDLCLGHMSINKFELVKNVFETSGFDPSVFTNCKKVYSGHFHIRSENDNIIYCGSPYQMNWGDEGNTKGVYIHNLETDQRMFFDNKVSPIFKKILYEDIKDKTDLSDFNLENCFVRVIVTSTISESEMNDLSRRLEQCNPLNFEIENLAEDYLQDNNISISAMKSSFDFLAEYVNGIGELPEDVDRAKLIDYLKNLYQACEEK